MQTCFATLPATTAALATLPAEKPGAETPSTIPSRPGAGSHSCQRATLSSPVPAPRSS